MSLYNVFSRAYIEWSSAMGFLATGMGAGAFGLALIAGVTGQLPAVAAYGLSHMLAASFLGIAGGALAFILWVLALQRTSPTRVAITMSVNPIAAASVAAVLLSEPITLNFIAGLTAVSIGIWVAATNSKATTKEGT